MSTAVAVEVEEGMDTAQVNDPALARWAAGIKEDLKALDEGTLETYTPEEFEAIMDDFEKELEQNARS